LAAVGFKLLNPTAAPPPAAAAGRVDIGRREKMSGFSAEDPGFL